MKLRFVIILALALGIGLGLGLGQLYLQFFQPAKSLETFHQESFKPNGSITICSVIVDGTGKFTDGSLDSGVELRLDPSNSARDLMSGKGTELPTNAVKTPLSLNTDLFYNDKIPDAACQTYDQLKLGSFFYGKQAGQPSNWKTPQYNDQFSKNIQTPEDFFDYKSKTGSSPNFNADGHIVLTSKRPNRTLAVLNQMIEVIATPVPSPTLNPSPTLIPSQTLVTSPTPFPNVSVQNESPVATVLSSPSSLAPSPSPTPLITDSGTFLDGQEVLANYSIEVADNTIEEPINPTPTIQNQLNSTPLTQPDLPSTPSPTPQDLDEFTTPSPLLTPAITPNPSPEPSSDAVAIYNSEAIEESIEISEKAPTEAPQEPMEEFDTQWWIKMLGLVWGGLVIGGLIVGLIVLRHKKSHKPPSSPVTSPSTSEPIIFPHQ